MSEQNPTHYELSSAVNEALTPELFAIGFGYMDLRDDDPSHKLYAAGEDRTHSRDFQRPSVLGFDTFSCLFGQSSEGQPRRKYITITPYFGVHITALEELEIKLRTVVNPYRLGKRLPHIGRNEFGKPQKHKLPTTLDKINFIELRSASELDEVLLEIMNVAHTHGKELWAQHQTLDHVQRTLEKSGKFERHSPRFAPQYSHKLMHIACLKRDRALFDKYVEEYTPHIIDIYEEHYRHFVTAIQQEFDSMS